MRLGNQPTPNGTSYRIIPPGPPKPRPEPPPDTSSAPLFTTAQFHVLLTLSSKFFSIFHHCTCLLSVSGLYLALRGVYLALWTALPSNPTRGRWPARSDRRLTGLSPSMGCGHCQVGL